MAARSHQPRVRALIAAAALVGVGCFSGAGSSPPDAPGGDGATGGDAAPGADASEDECLALPSLAGCAVVTCGRCYLVCDTAEPLASALDACAAWGGNLAQPQRATEQACLGEAIASFGWVDLHQADAATMAGAGWSWGGGSPFTGPWADGEPDDSGGAPGDSGVEQCGALVAASGLPLDVACESGRAQAICDRVTDRRTP